MLKMKAKCETCSTPLSHDADAFICSYECTFCPTCSEKTEHKCPNCDGELVRRPTRMRGVIDVATSQIKRKVLGTPK